MAALWFFQVSYLHVEFFSRVIPLTLVVIDFISKCFCPCKVTQCLIKLSDLQGMVEAGGLKPVTFTWTPPTGHDVSTVIKGMHSFSCEQQSQTFLFEVFYPWFKQLNLILIINAYRDTVFFLDTFMLFNHFCIFSQTLQWRPVLCWPWKEMSRNKLRSCYVLLLSRTKQHSKCPDIVIQS